MQSNAEIKRLRRRPTDYSYGLRTPLTNVYDVRKASNPLYTYSLLRLRCSQVTTSRRSREARTPGALTYEPPLPPKGTAYAILEGSGAMSAHARTDASGGASCGMQGGESWPKTQSIAADCVPIASMLHQRSDYASAADLRRRRWSGATFSRTSFFTTSHTFGPQRPPSSHARTT